ncbi:MAG TPA: DUF1839 family protein [Thermoanaerobaculia bacterium]|nr:DUF1839 family protein [Thermoanaerobaculia bacterium]
MTTRILDLDPKTYNRHAIHGEGRVWAETNCYVDVWVELAHALGYEPRAALPFTFTIDFEGDQWTFFKFPLEDLYELFGLDVHELAIYRPLTAHIEEQLQRGRPVLVELDSYYLPDTAGTAYKLAHVKSTVAAVKIDVEQQMLGYFHNQGYYELHGDDFAGALRTNEPHDTAMLPPYTEFVKIRDVDGGDGALLARSLALFRKHLELVPAANPFHAFKTRFEKDLQQLLHESLETFHNYSFATLRQYGACFELASTYLQWLTSQGEEGLEEPTRDFLEISESAKTMQFQLARSMARHKPLDLAPLDAMAERWERGIGALKARYS